MKGTIFERGNKFSNKFHRAMAWMRVKKYWLFMPHKEYKRNIFFNIVGMLTILIGAYIGILYLIAYVPLKAHELYDNYKKKKQAKETE